MQRAHWNLILIFSFCFFLSLVCATLFLPSSKDVVNTDFVGYLTGGLIIREGKGHLLYDPDVQLSSQKKVVSPNPKDWLLPYRYLPFVGLLFIPLTYFPLIQAYKLFAGLNFFLLLLIIILSLQMLPRLNHNKRWLFLPLIFIPIYFAIILGQTSVWLTLIFLFVYKYLKSGNYFTAGAISALALIKIQYLTIIPFLWILSKKRKNFFAGFIIFSSVLLLLGMFLSGGNYLLNYFSFLNLTESPQFGSFPAGMYSLHSFFLSAPFLPSLPFQITFILNAVGYLIALIIFCANLGKVSFDRLFVSALILGVLFSIHSLVHDISILLIPIFIILEENLNPKRESFTDFSKIKSFFLFFFCFLLLIMTSFSAPILLLVIAFYTLRSTPPTKRVVG